MRTAVAYCLQILALKSRPSHFTFFCVFYHVPFFQTFILLPVRCICSLCFVFKSPISFSARSLNCLDRMNADSSAFVSSLSAVPTVGNESKPCKINPLACGLLSEFRSDFRRAGEIPTVHRYCLSSCSECTAFFLSPVLSQLFGTHNSFRIAMLVASLCLTV